MWNVLKTFTQKVLSILGLSKALAICSITTSTSTPTSSQARKPRPCAPTASGSSDALRNAYNTLKVYHLQRPTEEQVQAETRHFDDLIACYRETLKIISAKKQGHYPMLDIDALHGYAEEQRLEAFHKIPTVFLLELNETLQQKHITL